MKARTFLSIISITLALALVVGGLTLAWFNDEAVPPDSFFTVGSIDYEVTAEFDFESESVVWHPGECKDFTWNLENTGSKTVFFRAHLIEELKVPGDETAWGDGKDGTRFTEQGNWATYFEYTGNPTIVDLIAGQHYEAGKVKAGLDEDNRFYVTYETDGSWLITETHLLVTNDDPGNNPLKTKNNNPAPGLFPYKGEHALVDEVTYYPLTKTDDPVNGVDLTGTVYIAAHAVVVNLEDIEIVPVSGLKWKLTDGYEGTWELVPEEQSEENVSWWYSCRPVSPGETITLNLTACLDEDAPEGVYTVQLEAQAAQATHGAVKEIWPDYPCGS